MKKILLILPFVILRYGIGAQNIPNYIPTDGLIAWYPFNGNHKDESGNNRHLNTINASLTADRCDDPNSAYHVNGDPNGLWIPHQAIFNSLPLTMSIWFKSTSGTNGGDLFWKYGSGSWNGWFLGLGSANGTDCTIIPGYLRNLNPCNGVIQGYAICGNPIGLNYTGSLLDSSWHLIVFKVDEVGGTVYYDGNPVSSQAWIGPPGMPTAGWFLNIGRNLVGDIDDVAFWSRGLSDEEVLKLYRGNKCLDFDKDCAYVNLDDFLDASSSSSGAPTGCFSACPESKATYFFTPKDSSTYSWEVVGGSYSYNSDSTAVDVIWSGQSNGTINIYEVNALQELIQHSFCIDILPTPVASFEFQSVQACKNAPISIINTTVNGTDYLWDFGDGSTSTVFEPSHSYEMPGTYTVTLYVSRRNLDSLGNALCVCFDTISNQITISELPAVDINCISTQCSNDGVYYWTTALGCQSYYWTVMDSNGLPVSFTGQGTDSIFVQWAHGPYGTVTLLVESCNEVYCSEPTSTKVDIIPSTIPILGKVKVCENAVEVYQVLKWPTVDYQWQVIGGEIIEGQGTNIVTVRWKEAMAGARISLNFSSPFLGGLYAQVPEDCAGVSSLDVNVLKRFAISLPTTSTYCVSSSSLVAATSQPWSSYHWEITPNVSFSGQGSNQIVINWDDFEQNYTITAVPTDTNYYCNFIDSKFASTVKIQSPVGVEGETSVCAGELYSYSPKSTYSNVGYNWGVSGGVINTVSNDKIEVVWDPVGPYGISLNQYFLSAPGCASDSIFIVPSKANLDTNMVIQGASACAFDLQTYTASSLLVGQPEYKWSIIPSTMGTIVSGQGTESVDIQWNGNVGNVRLSLVVKLCGDSAIVVRDMLLSETTEPEITQVGKFCPGSTVQLDAGTGYSSYGWTNNDTTQLATIALGGSFVVSVTNEFGCSSVSFFNATELPKPIANITRKKLIHCIGAIDSFVIRAAIGDGYKFKWYVDSTYLPTPANQDTFVHYFTNQVDVFRYWIEVSDENDCSAKSDTFFVFQNDCSGVIIGGNGCIPQAHFLNLTLSDNHPDCSTIDFDVTKSDSVTVLGWQFYDPADNINTGIYPDARHKFSETGCYLVEMDYRVPNFDSTEYCYYERIEEVRNPITAHFHIEKSCREFKFYDRSTYLRDKQPIYWKWYFGDGDSSTLKNPVHIYSAGGEYEVTLLVMNMDSCVSRLVKKVIAPGDPAGPIIASPNPACEGQPVVFSTGVEHILRVKWDFGNGTGSKLLNPTMTFDSAGMYQVSLIIDDTLGCSDTSFLDLEVNEFSNLLVDTIAWSPNLIVCEGNSVTLNAPSGLGYSYLWSNNSTDQQVITTTSGAYAVTVLDVSGCKHLIDPVNVLVSAYPDATIQGSEYLCGNGCVKLHTSFGPGLSYQWFTNGSPIPLENNSTLQVCKQTLSPPYTVEVTNSYGCSSISSSFDIVAVNPPEFEIQGSPKLCEGETVQLSILPIQPNVVYTWNTGAIDTAIQVLQKGIYIATGVDTITGCSYYTGQEIYPLPDLCYMPFGCYETCNPDTLFLPDIPDQASVAWYYNGNVISTHPSFLEVTEDGTYSVEVVTIHGCSDRSKEVSIEVVSGFGNLTANLWSDVNDNGLVDALDTLVSGFPLILQNNGVFIDTVSSLGQEAILWLKLPEGGYSVLVDTANLPLDWVAVLGEDSVSIVGCDQPFKVDLLVDYVCPNLQTTIELSACEGTTATYQGNSIPAGTTQQFTYQTNLGCDSVVQVQVLALPNNSATLSTLICPGDTLIFQGVIFTGPATQVFQLTTQQGCDSTLVLQVDEYPPYSSSIDVAVCSGEQFIYQNTALSPGQSQQFVLQSITGCDSLVTVYVSTLPASQETLNVSTCPGEAFIYEGVALQAGQSQTFEYTNAAGCDSLVLVQVAALPSFADSLSVSVCPGSTYSYQNVELSVGQSQLFSYTNSVGCDSTIFVQVAAYPSYTKTQEILICPGETYVYQGQALGVGQSQSFSLSSINGCDSTVLIQVMAYPSSSDTLEVSVCKGEVFSYNNQLFQVGTEQVFQYANTWGCDSSIVLQVSSYPELVYQYKTKPTCSNMETGGIEVAVQNGNSSGLTYSVNGSVFDTVSTFRLLEEGLYSVRVKDGNGCIQEENVSVSAYPPLEVVLPAEIVVPCDSNQVEVRPTIIGDTTDLELIWSNGNKGAAFFASEIGPITVRAKNGCRESAFKTTQIQWVDELRAPVPIYVPNVFSPYGQSPENSVFRTFFGPNFVIESYRLEVYDRFGSLVFVTEDESGEWSGEYNNRRVPDGVYVWKVEANVRVCGKQRKVQRSGDVTIVR